MPSARTSMERFDARFIGAIRWVLMLAMLVCLIWAGLLLLVQGATWLRTGIWQPVPLVALLLSTEAQNFNLQYVETGLSPLNFAPSWGSFDSPEAVTAHLAGGMVGLARILAWLLDVSLCLWLVVFSLACLGVGGSLEPLAPLST